MRTIFRLAIVISIAILFPSCATIFTKSTYPVTISSQPSQASIVITNKEGQTIFSGRTPAVVQLKSSSKYMSKAFYTVRMNYPGHQEYMTTIEPRFEGWYIANILIGGLVGMLIVDPVSGAMWTIDTKELSIDLKPEGSSLQVIDIENVPEEMKEKLVRIN